MQLLLLMMLLLLPLNTWATVIDTQEWSSTPSAPWNLYNFSGTVEIDPAPAGGSSPSGGAAVKFTMPAGTRGEGQIFGMAARGGDGLGNEFYIGNWVKWSSNWVWHPIGTKMMYIFAQADPNTGHRDNLLIANYPGGGGAGSPSGALLLTVQRVWGSLTYNYTPQNNYSFQANRWYWVQHHVKLNDPGASNGIWEMWVGDAVTGVVTKCLTATNLAMRAPGAAAGFSSFHHSIIYGGMQMVDVPAAQSMWVDHTVLATTQSETTMPGTVGGDTTAPAAPTGLTAR